MVVEYQLYMTVISKYFNFHDEKMILKVFIYYINVMWYLERNTDTQVLGVFYIFKAGRILAL